MDKTKFYIALCLFVLAVLAPIFVFITAGGITIFQVVADKNYSNLLPNIGTTLLVASGLFLLFAAAAIFVLFQIKDISKLAASLPFIFSTIYSTSVADAIPDLAPFVTRVDDTAAVSFGAIFSFLLALRRNKNTPKWILFPLLLAAIYTFFGGIFPSNIDELIVQVLAFLAYYYGISHPQKEIKPLPTPDQEEE